MPEGPEVWILSHVLNDYFDAPKTRSYGKHLFVSVDKDKVENWSFGMTGKVELNDQTHVLKKKNVGKLTGKVTTHTVAEDKLGLDWMTATTAELTQEIERWKTSKKKLATLMLEQSRLAGIGVAWGSEILFQSGNRPEEKACHQDLSHLVSSLVAIRQMVMTLYEKQGKSCHGKKACLHEFVQSWFHNLYVARSPKLAIYQRGTPLVVSGRTWWV